MRGFEGFGKTCKLSLNPSKIFPDPRLLLYFPFLELGPLK